MQTSSSTGPRPGLRGWLRRIGWPAQIGHGQTGITFGITGTTPGRTYMIAGLRITYQYRGATYQVTSWSVSVACVVPLSAQLNSHKTVDACSFAADNAQALTEKMPGR